MSSDDLAMCLEKEDVLQLARKVGLLSVTDAASADTQERKAVSERMCNHCGKERGKLICSRCRGARYCSEECQREAWRAGHKRVCGKK